MSAELAKALGDVDWNKNVADFLADEEAGNRLHACVRSVALWSTEFQRSDPDNPALAFVREMHASALTVTAALAVGLYKAAAGAMRAVVESALYFSYFRSHPAELATLVRDDKYYLSKKDIVDYHKAHTDGFIGKQEPLGFLSKLEFWYSRISAIVHGQIPGVWTSTEIADTSYDKKGLSEAVTEFERGVALVNYLFLTACGAESWASVSSESKKVFLKGLSAAQRQALGLSKQ